MRAQAARLGRQLPQPFRGQPRNQTNVVTRLRHLTQQRQPFNLREGIEPAICSGSLRFDRAITMLPNPDDVGAQTREPGDCLDGMTSVRHITTQKIYIKLALGKQNCGLFCDIQ